MDGLTSGLEEALYRCNKCGFCQATCPFYQTTQQEWTVARGRLRLMKGVHEHSLPMTDVYARSMYHCFCCGACSATCPSGVQVEELLLAGRRALARNGLLPDALEEMGRTLGATGSLTGEAGEARLSWAQNLESLPRQGGQHELVYFVGCVSSLYPQAYGLPQSMVGLLEREGADYAILGTGEVCCGYPLYISGLEDQARQMARSNLSTVRETGASRLLTTCPSCYRAWREFYPELLGEDLDIEVVHATEWLAEAALPLRPLEKRVTYHDPCDLGRGCGIYEVPREFLRRLKGLELVEMPYNRAEALCCGGGGNMESLDAESSRSVVRLRMEQAAGTGAEMVVTACPQCKRTLSGARSREIRVQVVDIIELAWLQLQNT